MLCRIEGVLVESSPAHVVLKVGGLYYEVEAPRSTVETLPLAGALVNLRIHEVIKEDSHVLYGFSTEVEKTAFRLLLTVTGVGPKTALIILSKVGVSDIAQAVENSDIKSLTRAGINGKTAERIIADLKGKFSKQIPDIDSPQEQAYRQDLMSALLSMGLPRAEILVALKTVPKGVNLSDGLRVALKHFWK